MNDEKSESRAPVGEQGGEGGRFRQWWKRYPAIKGSAHLWWFLMGVGVANAYAHPQDIHSWIPLVALSFSPLYIKLLWSLEARSRA